MKIVDRRDGAAGGAADRPSASCVGAVKASACAAGVRPLVAACALVLVVASAFVAYAGGTGERLVGPEPVDASEWVLQPDPSREATRLWKRKGNDREHLRFEVLAGSPDGVEQVRMTLDGPGKAACAVFDTTTIRDSPLNGYPRLLWRTDCEHEDGSRSTLLNLAVRGREHLYLALRSWPARVPEEEIAPWMGRFERFMVCDDRRPRQACPEGFVPLAPASQ